MKKVIFFFACLFLMSIIITSCEDSSGFNSPFDVEALTPSNDLQNATLSGFENAPTESGIVMRGEAPLGLTWVADGMRVIIGADIIEFCDGIIDFDLVLFQDVHINEERINSLVKGYDLQTAVFDFVDFDCSLFMSIPPIASGYSDLVGTDNDLLGLQEEDNNANAWGWSARGTLEDSAGESVKFSGFIKNVWNGNKFKSNTKINLN